MYEKEHNRHTSVLLPVQKRRQKKVHTLFYLSEKNQQKVHPSHHNTCPQKRRERKRYIHPSELYLSEKGLRQNADVRQGVRGDFHQPERTPDHGAALSDKKNRRFFSVTQGDEEGEVALVLSESPDLTNATRNKEARATGELRVESELSELSETKTNKRNKSNE